MPTFKELIDRLQQVACTRVGKVMVIVFVLSSIFLAAIAFAKWMGTIVVLDGLLGNIFNFALIICCFSLSYIIFAIIWFKPKANRVKLKNTISPSADKHDEFVSKKSVELVENDNLRKWARKIVLTWLITMMVIVYSAMGFFVWQNSVAPFIAQIAHINWSELTSKSIAEFAITLMVVTMYFIMPIIMYLDFSDKKRKAKESEEELVISNTTSEIKRKNK